MKLEKIEALTPEYLESIGFTWHTDSDDSSYICDRLVVISEDEANAYYEATNELYDFLTEVPHGYFVAIENEAPHRIKMFHCDTTFLEDGANKFDKAFKTLEKENWRDVSFDIQEVDDLIEEFFKRLNDE